jgi:hypothetical protein
MSFHFHVKETAKCDATVPEIRSPVLATRPRAGASNFSLGVPPSRLAVHELGFFAIK